MLFLHTLIKPATLFRSEHGKTMLCPSVKRSCDRMADQVSPSALFLPQGKDGWHNCHAAIIEIGRPLITD